MITNIIDSIYTEDSLTKPLGKALIFAKRIGNEDLANWLGKELGGYGKDEILPDYRYSKTSVLGVMKQNGRQTREQSLPLRCFGDYLAENLPKWAFNDSIAMLEASVINQDNQYIGKEFSADLCRSLTHQAQLNGCKFEVLSCRVLVSIPEIVNVIASIKTRLLNLLIQLEKEYPSVKDTNIDAGTSSQLNTTVNNYMGQINNIHNSGEIGAINTGNANTFNITKNFKSSEVCEKATHIKKIVKDDKALTELVREEVLTTFDQLILEVDKGEPTDVTLDKIMSYGGSIASIGSLVIGIIQLLTAKG